jgi:hypothetical protein
VPDLPFAPPASGRFRPATQREPARPAPTGHSRCFRPPGLPFIRTIPVNPETATCLSIQNNKKDKYKKQVPSKHAHGSQICNQEQICSTRFQNISMIPA